HGLHASSEAILELALAWYFTGKTAYADQAELVARAWYLNAATAMNPSMKYAQSKGPCGDGQPTGLIEASGGYMTDALDGLSILALDTRANGWTAADHAGMKAWLAKFVTFMKTSSQGQAENSAANNHGTWFDALLSSIYLYAGDTASATALVTASKTRIDSQVQANGSMPLELSRQTSWHYTNYNASALCRLAGVAKHVDVDLWGYTTPNGASITKVIEYMLPTATTTMPPGMWAQYNDITMPFDAAYQAESYYSVHAAAEYGNSAAAKAVFAAMPVPVAVPGHYCAGDRFPLGSDFCGITPGAAPFSDLQPVGTASVDMWPLIPTCRMPVD
ncbi:MAG TPA: alginate lyase family protein, partial [Polyangiaceae bacterium]|nr:alginate lyase family protein [Polyangiaceae bacterium]